MRLLLLASASVLGLAGAASAQDAEVQTGIIFGGEASFGFNSFEFIDEDEISADDRDEEGFFFEADLNITFRTVLDNGAVAESTFTIPIADENLGDGGADEDIGNDFVIGLTIDGAGGLFLGDVTFAPEDHFDFATMQSADFSEQDGEVTLKGTSVFGGVEVSASAVVLDGDGDEPGDLPGDEVDDERDFVDQLAVGADGDIGRFSFSFGYQEESVRPGTGETGDNDDDEATDGVYDPEDSNGDFNLDEQFGISLGGNLRGFDVQVGYGRNVTVETDSYGVSAGFPVGPITLTAEYVIEPDAEAYADDDNEDPDDFSYAVGAQYESGNFVLDASFGQEIGEEEYDVKVGYRFSDALTLQAGYNDDDGGFAAVRQSLGAGAFVEFSHAETDDSGFDNDAYVGDLREGTTLKVGLEF